MNRFSRLLLFILVLSLGCNHKDVKDKKISQSINNLNMNIYSDKGKKLLSIKSPYSNYDKDQNIYNLNETTIKFFKDNKKKYIITSDKSKVSNNNKLIELNGNVIVKSLIKQEDELYSNKFTWNIENSEFLLIGNVNFRNNSISLSSNKAILSKSKNIIEFFNPVQYKFNDGNNKSKYEVNSQNAYYNIETKSVTFSSKEEKVRSKIYF